MTRIEREPEPEAVDGEQPHAGTRAVASFRALVSALRLFKSGGVALGPHAWTRLGSGRWRRVATGVGRPRPGGYHLAETELSDLAALVRAVNVGFRRDGERSARRVNGFERALNRFEAGLERTVALDALNDHLLALRFLLEGGGPADLGLSMRVASLCAEPDRRSEVKAVIDRALALERELYSGEPPTARGEGQSPADTALGVEGLLRAILRDAACGHLGADLRATADEILLADGLAAGDGAPAQRGGTAEWAMDDSDELEVPEGEEIEVSVGPDAEGEEPGWETEPEAEPPWAQPRGAVMAEVVPEEHDPERPRYGRDAPVVPEEVDVAEGPARPALEVIASERRSTLQAHDEEETSVMQAQPARSEPEVAPQRPSPDDSDSPVVRLLALHSAEREATAARVANLFPAPETTEWNVREIAYDRKRRAELAGEAS